MARATTYQNSSDFEEYIRDLLECPVCMELIKSVPVYQCANGHVICMDCIEKLNNCPICRNDSELRRNLKLENIVQRLDGIQYENEKTTNAKPNLQKWGKGSVRVYGTINGPNREPRIEQNLQANPELLNPQANNQEAMEAAAMEGQILLIITTTLFILFICCYVTLYLLGYDFNK